MYLDFPCPGSKSGLRSPISPKDPANSFFLRGFYNDYLFILVDSKIYRITHKCLGFEFATY